MRGSVVRQWPILVALLAVWLLVEITTRLAAWLIGFFGISS